jgi:hypothetical protein
MSSRRARGQLPTVERGWFSAMAVDRKANNLSALRTSVLRTRNRGTRNWIDHFERPEQFKMYTNFVTWTGVP